MNKLQQIWHKITEIGVDEQVLGREVIKVRLLNQLIVFAFTVSLVNVPIYLYQGETLYLWSNVGNVTLEAATILFAFYKKHHLSRFIAVFVFSTLMGSHVLVHGLNFGSIFITLGIMAFILYEGYRKIQLFAIFYICVLFISTKLYVINNFDNTFQAHNYNELVHFPIVLIALGSMLMLYQREIKKYEERQHVLIDNLEDKNTELSQINEELERFTYIASHDLKTPLRSISSYLDLIKIHLDNNNKAAVYQDVKSAKTGTKQMYALIRDILEYKEINNSDLQKINLDLNHLIAESLENLDETLKKDTVEIISEGLPTIKGQKREFSLLMENIIENGLKYNTSKSPQIHINSTIDTDKILIFFQDNGIGISPEYHQKIFQLFKRLHRNEEYEGTGIGLGLCQKIVHRYNGKIGIESAKGQGSTFVVQLPIELLSKTQN